MAQSGGVIVSMRWGEQESGEGTSEMLYAIDVEGSEYRKSR